MHDVLGSPFGSVFSRPEIDQVMNCALGLRNPINVEALKAELSLSVITGHPRFTSLLVRNRPRFRPFKKQYWRKTVVNIDDHVIMVDSRHINGSNEAAINDYLAELAVSPPMSMDKPLWEVHVLVGINCVVLRVHHAIGDGISLMSLLTACFGGDKAVLVGRGGEERRWRKGVGVFGMVKSVWYTAVYEVGLVCRILGVSRDQNTVVSGGVGVELGPRKVVTAKFEVEVLKQVKRAIPSCTMNDVLLGVIASGLAKYFDVNSPEAMMKGIQITGLVVANLRKHSGLQDIWNLKHNWGNKLGLFLVPIHCRRQEPVDALQHVTRMKSIMDKKKKSFEAHILYSSFGFAVSHLGSRISKWIYKRVFAATTVMISNIVGPRQEIVVAGSPVTYIKLSISSLCQAMTIHLVSYKERADMQISIAQEIIPDAEFLAQCFEDALLEIYNVVEPKQKCR